MIGLQMTMPELIDHMATTRHSVGATGETVVARAFEANGYSVAITHDCGDMTVYNEHGEAFHVEVKTSTKGKDGRYRFNLYKRGSQDHRDADFVVLLAVGKTGFGVPFVVPVDVIRDKHHLAVGTSPNFYRGYLAAYRQSMRKLRIPEVSHAD
jgi:hypothetical protein